MILRSAKLALDGMSSGLAYRLDRRAGRHQYPTFLIYQFTNNCNSRCQMCNIWKKPSRGELSTRELKAIFEKPLFRKLRWVNLTGGEPFLRDDIVDVVSMLNRLPRLEGVAIPSNGFMTERIVAKTKEMLDILGKGKFLSITLSIDGFEKTHDDIRGVPGAYNRVKRTLDELLKLKKQHGNFNVGIQPTISKRNLDEIWRFYRHMKKKTSSVGFAVMMTSEGYYSNTESRLALTKKDKKRVAMILERAMKEDPQYAFYYSKLIELYRTGRRNFGCLAGHLTLYVDPFGHTYPCPALSYNKDYLFGSIKDNVWFTKKAGRIKKKLQTEQECEHCSMMCDFINMAKVEFYEHAMWMMMHPASLSRLLKKAGAEKNPYF
jgi:MoaA/NifB/PqqE/SkfB family radical SAM enzyme